ncbi:MAG: YdcF family protein [Chitinophagales bacterium]|nr:YdcF family protein [Chitinophagales bacterium]MDW8417969.1 YdcF family protein [Chitinophagales bacterium]
MKKLLILIAGLLLFAGGAYLLRYQILTSLVEYLICQDDLQPADALFVLSGGGYDRGNEAARVFRAGYVPVIVCTGANPVVELRIFNMDTLESDMTVANLRRWQVPDSCIYQIRYGTSTREEADTIIKLCTARGYRKIMILSSRIHTRRVREVFQQRMQEKEIAIIIRGAPSSRYDEYHWWQSEEGLIAVNNEWIKTLYYWWKY